MRLADAERQRRSVAILDDLSDDDLAEVARLAPEDCSFSAGMAFDLAGGRADY